jgi:hypothetical protein
MTSPSGSSDGSSAPGAAVSCPIPVLMNLPEPNDFYEEYVRTRRAVIFRSSWNALQGKKPGSNDAHPVDEIPTIESLRTLVGKDSLVEVNHRGSAGKSFSPYESKVEPVSFHKFLKELSENHYMTTQTLPLDEEGRPALFTTPMAELVDNDVVKLRPKLFGNLIPATYNVWLGTSSTALDEKGPSSGLHHDYHDNLYCVWHGTKIIQLSPPTKPLVALTNGTMSKQYENGRIVYQEQLGQGMIRADGALESVETILQLEKKRDELVQKMEVEQDNDELEEELERVEEELLDLENNQGNRTS